MSFFVTFSNIYIKKYFLRAKKLHLKSDCFAWRWARLTKSWPNSMWKKSQKMWWILRVTYKTKTCFLLAWKICTIISKLCVVSVRTLCPHYSLRLEKGNPRNTYATGSVISYIQSCHWTLFVYIDGSFLKTFLIFLHPNLISAGSRATVLKSLVPSDVTGCECKRPHWIYITVHQLRMCRLQADFKDV